MALRGFCVLQSVKNRLATWGFDSVWLSLSLIFLVWVLAASLGLEPDTFYTPVEPELRQAHIWAHKILALVDSDCRRLAQSVSGDDESDHHVSNRVHSNQWAAGFERNSSRETP